MKTKGKGVRGKLLDVYVLAKQFKPYFDMWMSQREELGIESEWLFPKLENYDEHIGVSTIDSWSKTFSKMLGRPFYPHALRHLFCTNLLEQNLPENIVDADSIKQDEQKKLAHL